MYAHMIYKLLASTFFILLEPTYVICIKTRLNCWLERRWKSNIKRKLRKIVTERLDGFHHCGSVILIRWPCALRFVNLIYPLDNLRHCTPQPSVW